MFVYSVTNVKVKKKNFENTHAIAPRYSVKVVLKHFTKFSAKHQHNIIFFNKIAGWWRCSILLKRLRHRGFPFSSEFCESRENIISLNICQRLLMKLDPDKVKLNLKDGPFRGCSRMGEGTRSPHHGPPALPKILSRTYYNNETWHSCILDKKHRKNI